MEWRVYCYNLSKREIAITNIFFNNRFNIEVQNHLEKCNDKIEFSEKLKSSLMYYFYSKREYEIVITARGSKDVKLDIYSQVMLNWNRFVDYCWSFKKPKIREKIKEKADDR